MKKNAAELQKSCVKCQESLDVGEFLFVEEAGDWRHRYLVFLQHKLLPPNRTDAVKI